MRFGELFLLILKSLPPLFTPFLILGGIIGGFVTPTEAAVLACIYAFLICKFWYRTIQWSDLPGIFKETLRLSSLALFALSTAGALGELLSYYQVSQMVAHFFSAYIPNAGLFLAFVILFFLFIGTFLDGIPAMILFVPVLLPASQAFGIHDIHMGIVVVLCMAIGLVTPPYGMCLLLASSIGDLPLGRASIASIPYILAVLGVLLLVTYVPDVALYVPKMIRPDWFGVK